MDLILSGYGKMGKEIEKVALAKNHSIVAKIDNESDWQNLHIPENPKPVVIDFSQPDVVVNNIKNCFDNNFPIIIGTTGWDKHHETIKTLCIAKKQALIIASNFSVGVNIFFALNQYLAKVMNQMDEYDVSLSETHHIHKLDKPSGTAVTIADQILESFQRKVKWTLSNQNNSDELLIDSIREGEVIGDHLVRYTSNIDEIEIKHHAKNRKGFALGAVLAAEWIQGKKGIYEMSDVLGF